ncbi:MAG: hypothetical protein IKP40_00990 [Clostridia bacterium]|nr:hypothetical protein [Clostridia bacterium]
MDCPQCGAALIAGALSSTGSLLWRDAPSRKGFRALFSQRPAIPLGWPGGPQAIQQTGYRCPRCGLLFIPLRGSAGKEAEACGSSD